MTRDDVPPLDLADALRAVGEAPPRVDVDAGFFHRTLARWLGLPEGRVRGQSFAPVHWDYGFWKAELQQDGVEEDVGGVRRERWSATLFRVRDTAPERVAWTVDKDARGAIVASAWLTAAPRLVDDAPASADDVPDLDDAVVARLLSTDGDDPDGER